MRDEGGAESLISSSDSGFQYSPSLGIVWPLGWWITTGSTHFFTSSIPYSFKKSVLPATNRQDDISRYFLSQFNYVQLCFIFFWLWLLTAPSFINKEPEMPHRYISKLLKEQWQKIWNSIPLESTDKMEIRYLKNGGMCILLGNYMLSQPQMVT